MFNYSTQRLLSALWLQMPIWMSIAIINTRTTIKLDKEQMHTEAQGTYLPLATLSMFGSMKSSPTLRAIDQWAIAPSQRHLAKQQQGIDASRKVLDTTDEVLEKVNTLASFTKTASLISRNLPTIAIAAATEVGVNLATSGIKEYFTKPQIKQLQEKELKIRNHIINHIENAWNQAQKVDKASVEKMIKKATSSLSEQTKVFVQNIMKDEANAILGTNNPQAQIALRRSTLKQVAKEVQINSESELLAASGKLEAELSIDKENEALILDYIKKLQDEFAVHQADFKRYVAESIKEKQEAAMAKDRIDMAYKSAEICYRLGALSGSADMQDFGAMACHMVDLCENASNFISCLNTFVTGAISGATMSVEPLTGAAIGLLLSIVKVSQTCKQLGAEQEDTNKFFNNMFKTMIKGFEHMDKRLDHIEQGQKQIYDLVYFGLKCLERQISHYNQGIMARLGHHEIKLDLILEQNLQTQDLIKSLIAKDTYNAVIKIINYKASDFKSMSFEEFKALRDSFYNALMSWHHSPNLFSLIGTGKNTLKPNTTLDQYITALNEQTSVIRLMESHDKFAYLNWMRDTVVALQDNPDPALSGALCHPIIWADAAKAYMVLICNAEVNQFYQPSRLAITDEESKLKKAYQPIETYIALLNSLQQTDIHHIMMNHFIAIQRKIHVTIENQRHERIIAYRNSHRNVIGQDNNEISPFNLETSIFSIKKIYQSSEKITPFLDSAKQLIEPEAFNPQSCFPFTSLTESNLFLYSKNKRGTFINDITTEIDLLQNALAMHMLVWQYLNRLSCIRDDCYWAAFMELHKLQIKINDTWNKFKNDAISFEEYQCLCNAYLNQSELHIEYMQDSYYHPNLFDKTDVYSLSTLLQSLQQIPLYLRLSTELTHERSPRFSRATSIMRGILSSGQIQSQIPNAELT